MIKAIANMITPFNKEQVTVLVNIPLKLIVG